MSKKNFSFKYFKALKTDPANLAGRLEQAERNLQLLTEKSSKKLLQNCKFEKKSLNGPV